MNHIKPGGWVRVNEDGICLKKGDRGIVFTIEKGHDPEWFGVYCFDKEAWEYFQKDQIK